MEYIVKSFVRTYNKDGSVDPCWRLCGDIKIETPSFNEITKLAIEKLKKDLEEKVKIADFLIDQIIEPDGNMIQCAVWDESGM